MFPLNSRDDGSGVVVSPPLSQAVGYVVVVVIGLVIAFGVSLLLLKWNSFAGNVIDLGMYSHDVCNKYFEKDGWGR